MCQHSSGYSIDTTDTLRGDCKYSNYPTATTVAPRGGYLSTPFWLTYSHTGASVPIILHAHAELTRSATSEWDF